MNIYYVSFFGHRDFYENNSCSIKLKEILYSILERNEFVEFLIGRNGEFDQFVSSSIRRLKKETDYKNFIHTLILPYATSEFLKNQENFYNYYDEIEICEKSDNAFYKSAITIRNQEIIKRSSLVICYVNRESGGAYQSMLYAKKHKKPIINLNDFCDLKNSF